MDDTPEKTAKIKSVLMERCLLQENEIEVAEFINGGRKALAKNVYDLLILDLVMPINEGEEVGAAGNSENFIEELSRVGRLHKPAYIIALTQYEEKIKEHEEAYQKKLWKLIHYDLKQKDWEDVLQETVDTIITTKKQLLELVQNERRYHVGVLCALPEEFEQMKMAFGVQWEAVTLDGMPYALYTTQIRTEYGHTIKVIACCNNAAGMQATSITASFLLSRFELDTLFMTGFCAGFKKKGVNYGDLFIADSEYDYGSGKLVKNDDNKQELKPEPKQIPCSYETLTKLNDFISEDMAASKVFAEIKRVGILEEGQSIPNIHVGPGACGSYVVGDEEFMARLVNDDNRKLQGLDMEGYGLYLAGHMLKKNCVLVKGIADFGNKKKDDRYHKVCSYESAWFVAKYIKSRL
jgi:nucleoside phosphorylase